MGNKNRRTKLGIRKRKKHKQTKLQNKGRNKRVGKRNLKKDKEQKNGK